MKPRVLIAEPNRTVADDLGQYLEGHGYHVEIAAGGLDAVEMLRESLPQVLVMSTELLWGGCDGVLDLIRNKPSMPLIPVVLTETNGATRDRADYAVPPVVQRMHRPFAPSDLFQILEGMTANGTAG